MSLNTCALDAQYARKLVLIDDTIGYHQAPPKYKKLIVKIG